MKFQASHRFVRIGPRKARYVIDLVRSKPVNSALEILRCVQKRAAVYIRKVLNSAIANADQHGGNVNDLIITEARVDGGPMLKRFRPGPMGRAMRIRRRMSHIFITVEEKVATITPKEKTAEKALAKVEKPNAEQKQ